MSNKLKRISFISFIYSMNIGCARHSSSKLDSALACTTFKFFEYLAALGRAQASLALLLLARHFRENGRYCCYRMYKIIYSLADPADNRRQTPNPKTTRFLICLSLRNNTACCIPLRHLRNLRENKHVRALNRNPKVSRRFTQTKPQPPKTHQLQPVFLCEIIQPCCIRLRNQRNLRENIHIRVLNQSSKKPRLRLFL